MYTMDFDIQVGSYQLGMVGKVEIHSSVELLAPVDDRRGEAEVREAVESAASIGMSSSVGTCCYG